MSYDYHLILQSHNLSLMEFASHYAYVVCDSRGQYVSAAINQHEYIVYGILVTFARDKAHLTPVVLWGA